MKLLIEDVYLQYRILSQENLSMRYKMGSFLTFGMSKQKHPIDSTVYALNGINLECKDGDRIAILGHNGAGKSTLLKTIAGILQPSSGRIIREGRVSSFLSLGFGLDMESTGYENIFLMGYLRNRTKKTSYALVEKILDVCELGDAIHRPVFSYSSGMMMRLAFAINCCEDPEIFLIDEFFGTGDAKFQEKSTKIMLDLLEKSGILLLATHSEHLAHQICNKAVKIQNGCIVESYNI